MELITLVSHDNAGSQDRIIGHGSNKDHSNMAVICKNMSRDEHVTMMVVVVGI